VSARLGELGRVLVNGCRVGELEIYEKRGRSRRFELAADGETLAQSLEAGWAARGGDRAGSWFVSGSGELPARLPEVPAGAPPIALPPAQPATTWSPPRDFDVPLATESEGRALLAGIARELARELPDLAPPRLRLDDGASEWAIVSTRGVAASGRGRSAALRIEAARGPRRVEAELTARSATDFKPTAAARRIADRLLALDGELSIEGATPLLLAPPVAARLIEALAAQLIDVAAHRRLAGELGGSRRLAAESVTLVDDGGFAPGLLSAAVDGEGVPTRRVTLVDRGRLAEPLLAWWESGEPSRTSGCVRRDGWRGLPTKGATQLFVVPESQVTVGDLLTNFERGAYLIAAEGGVVLDRASDRFTLPVSGFALRHGRAAAGLGPCRLVGDLQRFLTGVRGIARDLSFVPGFGLFGSPTLSVEGLELLAD